MDHIGNCFCNYLTTRTIDFYYTCGQTQIIMDLWKQFRCSVDHTVSRHKLTLYLGSHKYRTGHWAVLIKVLMISKYNMNILCSYYYIIYYDTRPSSISKNQFLCNFNYYIFVLCGYLKNNIIVVILLHL